MPLNLHIFEPRYKEMMRTCLDERAPFGVVLIRKGVEALGPLAEPHLIGCTAEIAQVQPLEGGQMNILAVGRERFRILDFNQEKAYLTGAVEPFPLDMPEPGSTRAVRELRPLLEAYLRLLGEAGDLEFDVESIPDDPELTAYLGAAVLQMPNETKQALLTIPDAAHMLRDMRTLYRRELPLLRRLLAEPQTIPEGPGPFSLS